MNRATSREQIAEVAMQPVREIDHLAGVDVERRAMHRLQHFVGHVGGAGEGQDFTARANGHCCLSLRISAVMDAAYCPGFQARAGPIWVTTLLSHARSDPSARS